MNVAIIAAAGQGTRMGGKRAKQFLELAGTPIIIHTLKAFEACDAIQEIILQSSNVPSLLLLYNSLFVLHNLQYAKQKITIVSEGTSRQFTFDAPERSNKFYFNQGLKKWP